jgi:hypothetical protein
MKGADENPAMASDRCITWKIDEGVGHLVFATPPSNPMTRFFFLNSVNVSNRI